MSRLVIPKGYHAKLTIKETEEAIKLLKDYFERRLGNELNLKRVSSPLFVRPETGLNDNLNGMEKPVTFQIKDSQSTSVEVVHSLAKWKRMALKRYGFSVGEGIYTDMNAIRAEEDLGNLHSVYVDQWDWEKIIEKEDRNEQTLYQTVQQLFQVFKDTESYIAGIYSYIEPILPNKITFITSQELEDKYPNLTPKERENAIAKEKKAVFISQIGGPLRSGERHDGRSPDYDDWTLNGDIIFWYPVLEKAIELSSMGIRVDHLALTKQLEVSNCQDRANLEFHSMVLDEKLPFTIGGGIGQSRICMYFLRKAHIGEVQASVWPNEMIEKCDAKGIQLL
jgi:aspartate--ammonia ligase